MLASHPKLALALGLWCMGSAYAAWFHVPSAIAAKDPQTIILALAIAGAGFSTGIYALARSAWGFIVEGIGE